MALSIDQVSAEDGQTIRAIEAGLRASNRTKMAAQGLDLSLIERHEIRLAARDGAALCGGLLGYVKYSWLYVDTLWVAADRQSQGIGAALLGEAERQAMDLGAKRSWLLSLTLEAPDYYLRHGYRVFAELPDYPAGHSMRFLEKTLVE